MVQSPSATPNDPSERLARLERVVEALANKTLYSADVGAGGLTINGGTLDVNVGGVDKFHIGPDQTTIRDQANDIIISDDATAGWGYTQPNIQYALFPNMLTYNIQSFYSTGALNVWQDLFQGNIIINNPKLVLAYTVGVGSNGALVTVNYRAQVTLPGAGGTVIISPADSISTSAAGFTQHNTSLTYNWPSNIFGQQVLLELQGQFTAGTTGGAVSMYIQPITCYGKGII